MPQKERLYNLLKDASRTQLDRPLNSKSDIKLSSLQRAAVWGTWRRESLRDEVSRSLEAGVVYALTRPKSACLTVHLKVH
jgi:hypothetical protein